jgi:hypothetical protein
MKGFYSWGACVDVGYVDSRVHRARSRWAKLVKDAAIPQQ